MAKGLLHCASTMTSEISSTRRYCPIPRPHRRSVKLHSACRAGVDVYQHLEILWYQALVECAPAGIGVQALHHLQPQWAVDYRLQIAPGDAPYVVQSSTIDHFDIHILQQGQSSMLKVLCVREKLEQLQRSASSPPRKRIAPACTSLRRHPWLASCVESHLGEM